MEGDTSRKALFSNPKREVEATENAVDLTALLEPSMLFLRQDTPQEVVISMFQKLVRRLFTEETLLSSRPFSPAELAPNIVYACRRTICRVGNQVGHRRTSE